MEIMQIVLCIITMRGWEFEFYLIIKMFIIFNIFKFNIEWPISMGKKNKNCDNVCTTRTRKFKCLLFPSPNTTKKKKKTLENLIYQRIIFFLFMHFVKYKLFSSANVRLPVPAVIAQPSPNLYECWYVCVCGVCLV